jgi:hypothetical protein
MREALSGDTSPFRWNMSHSSPEGSMSKSRVGTDPVPCTHQLTGAAKVIRSRPWRTANSVNRGPRPFVVPEPQIVTSMPKSLGGLS